MVYPHVVYLHALPVVVRMPFCRIILLQTPCMHAGGGGTPSWTQGCSPLRVSNGSLTALCACNLVSDIQGCKTAIPAYITTFNLETLNFVQALYDQVSKCAKWRECACNMTFVSGGPPGIHVIHMEGLGMLGLAFTRRERSLHLLV